MRYAIPVLVLLVALLPGCHLDHLAYHSTEEISYRTDVQDTEVRLVGEESGPRVDREYIVLAARDTDGDPYVLITPKRPSSRRYEIRNADLQRSVPLQIEEAERLRDAVLKAADEWDQSESRQGRFSEFTHAPEQTVEALSEDVVEWYPALRFTAAHTEEGSTARLELGSSLSEIVFRSKIENEDTTRDFGSLLRKAEQIAKDW